MAGAADMIHEAVENLLNRNFGQSPRARELCRELDGKALHVDIRGTPWQFTVESLGHSLRLSRTSPATPPSATVSGSAVNLLALAGSDPHAVIRRGDVAIDGDAEIAENFQQLLHCLRPDFEEELSQMLGDASAHHLMRLASTSLGFGRRVIDTGLRNTAEYLAHESGDLVPRAEAEQFLDGVGRLREDVDRLEARIDVLAARQQSNAT